LVRTGQKQKPEFSAIREKYADLFTKESIAAVRETIDAERDARVRERMERTLFALLEGFMAEKELPLEEAILTAQSKLSTTIDFEKIGYHDFAGKIAREDDFGKREALRAAQIGLVEQLNPKYLELQQVGRQNLSAFGFNSPREYAETKKKIAYEPFLRKTIPILEETTGLYRRVMSDVVRKAYGRELGEIGAVHALHWRAGREFAHHFPGDKLVAACKQAFATLGLDLDGNGAIAIDAENRPQKNPRACCYAAQVPEEVHLIIKPKGGFDDYRAFMHEGGHALHFAHTEASLPYEWRELHRSHALTEIFSFLMEHLTENPLWLEHVLKLPKAAAERVATWALLGNLFMLRRYIAKFTYELAFDEKPYDNARNKALYAETLHELTGFRYEPELYLEDMDGLFYSADYLRAWIASAQLEEHLIRKFGDRWFLKRETGAFLKTLYAKGVSWENEDLVQSLGMTPWDPLPLIRKFDTVAKLLR
jgi:hypothetical protein